MRILQNNQQYMNEVDAQNRFNKGDNTVFVGLIVATAVPRIIRKPFWFLELKSVIDGTRSLGYGLNWDVH